MLPPTRTVHNDYSLHLPSYSFLFVGFQVVAEMIATFLLVFVTCGAGALSVSNSGVVSQLGASVAGGLIVTVMIYAVGHISGAHMNPAVTFAFAVSRHFPWIQVATTKLERDMFSGPINALLPLNSHRCFNACLSSRLTLLQSLSGPLLHVCSDLGGHGRLLRPPGAVAPDHQPRDDDAVRHGGEGLGHGNRGHLLHDVRHVGGSNRYQSCESLRLVLVLTSCCCMHACLFVTYLCGDTGRRVGRVSCRFISVHNLHSSWVKQDISF
ncbi:hypothetical protein BHM03_00006114 [Ensete ventricosum]|uniref:Aquaporin n=1 Tax=Ensete ventricosum TaxID=4639 RepID=A0A445MBH7_ENSVE|nr:hypothetical protein BHM03_00006114 [Ensete ventricosum]